MQARSLYPLTCRNFSGKANNQGDVERVVIHAVMVIPTVVLVERFAVVAIDDDQRIVFESEFRYAGYNALNAGIHVGDGSVALCIDVVAICDARRHPIGKKVAKGLEVEDGLHGFVFWIEFISAVKHALKGCRRKIGRVRVHMSHKEKEGFF